MKRIYFVDVNKIDSKLYYLEDKKVIQAKFVYDNEQLDFIYNSCVYAFNDEKLVITPKSTRYESSHYSYFEKKLNICGIDFKLLDRIGNYAKFVVDIINDSDYELVFLFSDYIMANNDFGTGISDKSISMKGILEKMNKYLRTNNHKVIVRNAFISNFIRYFTLLNLSVFNKNFIYIDDSKYHHIAYLKEVKRLEYKKRNTQNDIFYISKLVSDNLLTDLFEEEKAKIYGYTYDLCAHDQQEISFILRDIKYKINPKSIYEKLETGKKDFEGFLSKLNKKVNYTIYHSISHEYILEYTKDLVGKHLKDFTIEKFDQSFLSYFIKYAMFLTNFNQNEKDKEYIQQIFKKEDLKIFSDQKNLYLYLGMFSDQNSDIYKELKEISYPVGD